MSRRPAATKSKAKSRSRSNGWVGMDLARPTRSLRPPSRMWPPVFIALLAAALFLAALRIDIIRMRYARASVLKVETALREEQQQLLVEVRRLHHPSELSRRADALGFQVPDEVVELAGPARALTNETLPHIASGPDPFAADTADLVRAGVRP